MTLSQPAKVVEPTLAAATWSNRFLCFCVTLLALHTNVDKFRPVFLYNITSVMIKNQSVLYLLLCLGSLSRCMAQFRPGFSLTLTLWLHGVQVLWLQTTQILTAPPPGWQLLWGAAVFGFLKWGIETSPLWCHFSKGHCSKTSVVCSDAALQT